MMTAYIQGDEIYIGFWQLRDDSVSRSSWSGRLATVQAKDPDLHVSAMHSNFCNEYVAIISPRIKEGRVPSCLPLSGVATPGHIRA